MKRQCRVACSDIRQRVKIRILTLLTSGTLTSLSVCPPLFPFGIIVNLTDITDKISLNGIWYSGKAHAY